MELGWVRSMSKSPANQKGPGPGQARATFLLIVGSHNSPKNGRCFGPAPKWSTFFLDFQC
eukprot:12917011-Prorocentrum_lima.AAC.1